MSSHRQKFLLTQAYHVMYSAAFLVAARVVIASRACSNRACSSAHNGVDKTPTFLVDEYRQEVIDESDLSLKPLLDEGAVSVISTVIISGEQRDWYSTEHRADEFERERVLALMNSRVPITLERPAAQQRDLKSPQDVYYDQQFADGELPDTNPVLNHLYSKDSRVGHCVV